MKFLAIISFSIFYLSMNTVYAQTGTPDDTTWLKNLPPPIICLPPIDFSDTNRIFHFEMTEEPPEFPGGEEAMRKFIKDNLVYPAEAREKGEQGKVYVRFVVETDGSITNVSIARGVSPSLDAEAMRIVNMMPNWIPEKHRATPVRSNVVIPIVFKL